jgi:hypothetical protein
LISSSLKRKQFMNLFFATGQNMTARPRFESMHRFKTLEMRGKAAAHFCGCEVVFAGRRGESFPLRETGHAVSLTAFAAPTALETSAV